MDPLLFWISNFRRVLNIVYVLLGISPASDCVLPTFRNPLLGTSSKAGCGLPTFRNHLSGPCSRARCGVEPLKMDLTEGSETSAKHNLTPGKYAK
jgi:hypothetical protein